MVCHDQGVSLRGFYKHSKPESVYSSQLAHPLVVSKDDNPACASKAYNLVAGTSRGRLSANG